MTRRRTDPLDEAAALHARALTLHDAGSHRRALAVAERSVALFARHCGRLHPDVASALDTVATIHHALGDTREGLRLLRRALAILDRYPRHREVRPFRAQSLVHLASALRDAGRYAEARTAFQRALRVCRGAHGATSVEYAAALNLYGMLCKFAGWFAAGEAAYRRALVIAEAEGDRELEAAVLHNLGGLEHARDRFVAAESYARKGLALRVSLHGEDHLGALEDLGALAAIVTDLGRHEEAAAMLRQLLVRFEALRGRGHYEVAVVCHNLASALASTGRLDEADALYRRALAIKVSHLGARHPDVAITLHNLAALCEARGDAREARRLHRRAFAVAARALGSRHPTTRACRPRRT